MSEYSVTFPNASFEAYPSTVSKTVDYLSENATINIPSRSDLYSFGLNKPNFEDSSKLWVELPHFASVSGIISNPLTFQLPLVPGATSYVFDSLPAGLSCSLSGLISGTPTVSGLIEKTLVVTTPSSVFNEKVLFSILPVAASANPAPQTFTPNYSGDLYASRTDFQVFPYMDPISPASNWTSAFLAQTVPAVIESQNKAFILAQKPSVEDAPRLIQLNNFGLGVTNNTLTVSPVIFAGSGFSGNTNGTGTAASWSSAVFGPYIDSSGNLYIVDRSASQNIRKINSSAQVTTHYTHAGVNEDRIFTGIPAMDSSANFYVSLGVNDANRRVGKITSAGVFSVLAGSAGNVTASGYVDATGTAAEFNEVHGGCFDSSGNLFVCDFNNHRIRKITPAGVVTTFAGSGVNGNADGTGLAAEFSNPVAITSDSSDNLYVLHGTRLRKITPAGVVTTVATTLSSSAKNASLAVDSSGNVYQCNFTTNRVLKITPAGVVSNFAGSGVAGSGNGTGTGASFSGPSLIVIDNSDNLYVVDENNYTIRKITSAAVVTTLAGNPGNSGNSDGTAGNARFNFIINFGINKSNGTMTVFDVFGTVRIRSITSAGVVTTLSTFPSSPYGYLNGPLSKTLIYSSSYRTTFPVTNSGLIYFADSKNNVIRLLDITNNSSSVFVGKVYGIYIKGGLDGTGSAAKFEISGLAVDSSGNVYLADQKANVIQKITPAGVVTTLAGLAYHVGSNDGTGSAARFDNPVAVAVDSAGNVFVADAGNTTVRRITPAGVVTTVCGLAQTPPPDSSAFYDGVGSRARFNPYLGIAGMKAISVSSQDNIYLTEERSTGQYYSKIRRISKIPDPFLGINSSSLYTWYINAPNSFQITQGDSGIQTSFYFNSTLYTNWASPSLPTVSSYSASGLPPGVVINSSTGLLTGAPTVVGVYNSVITSTQTYGSVSKGLSIEVPAGVPAIEITRPNLRKYSQSYWKEFSTLKRGDIVLVPNSQQVKFPWGESNVTYDMSYWGEPNVSVPVLPSPPSGFKYKYYIGKNIGESSLPVIY